MYYIQRCGFLFAQLTPSRESVFTLRGGWTFGYDFWRGCRGQSEVPQSKLKHLPHHVSVRRVSRAAYLPRSVCLQLAGRPVARANKRGFPRSANKGKRFTPLHI